MKRTDYRVCEYCGAALDAGERCDCMDKAPKIAGRVYSPVRREDGEIVYYGFPEFMVSEHKRISENYKC